MLVEITKKAVKTKRNNTKKRKKNSGLLDECEAVPIYFISFCIISFVETSGETFDGIYDDFWNEDFYLLRSFVGLLSQKSSKCFFVFSNRKNGFSGALWDFIDEAGWDCEEI